jgi:hypothetical protein
MSHQKGMISEKYVEYFFLKNGFKVLQPELADSPFDLLVTQDYTRFLKIQVKTLRVSNDRDYDQYTTDLKRGRDVKYGYKSEEVDYFALFEPVTEKLYILPFSDAPRKVRIGCNSPKYEKYLFNLEL